MTGRLAARNVTFAYGRGQAPVLQEWTGTFHASAMTAIIGPSGAGKSSLLFLLGLMLRPGSGSITVDGERVDELPDAGRTRLRARRFGFIFQDSCLDPRRTVLDNVGQTPVFRGEPRRTWEDRARSLLDAVGVSVPVTRRPGQVSGGQAQRIALCRALIHDPDIVLADEPTGNLDEASAGVVVAELRRRAEAGAAVVIVTHSADIAEACDTVVELTPLSTS